ncbi:TRAP transporter small permease [Bacillus sp. es.034]|uniref:TRAP transporter small permease n=1 Tax=Bacillus sp. es.034 TaxID=1761763 RepID=UPI000BF593D2|nr:TRAP transporter small permease [Bacillus sp. es.034]PFG03351.1 TRAP-type C4-dicarboxylate transport system permease small subunit [Bacillus sp. es.034]
MLSFVKLMDHVNKAVLIFIGLLTGVMAAVIITQVFSRFVLSTSLSWSEELARYLSIYAVFLGAAVALRKQGLISVEVLHEFIPAELTKWLKIIVNIICIIFSIILIVEGIEMMDRVQIQSSPAMQIPMSIPYASIPIGSLLMALNGLVVIIELIKGVNKHG